MDRFEIEPFAQFYQVGKQKELYILGNQIQLLSPDQLRKWLDAIYQTYGSRDFPGIILPRLTTENVVYYALTRDQRESRKLAPLLRSFAGPTILWEYSVTDKDLLDRELLKLNFGKIRKFSVRRKEVPNHLFEERKFRAIEAMYNLVMGVERAVTSVRVPPRTLSELLDRFELALDAGEFSKCEKIIDELREGCFLDHMNLSFLRVRIFKAKKDWDGLVKWQNFPRLCRTRRPGRISAVMIKALFRTQLVDLGNDIETLVNRFIDVIMPDCGSLFDNLPDMAEEDVLRTFAIYATVTESVSHISMLDDISQRPGFEHFARFWNICRSHLNLVHTALPSVTPSAPVLDDLIMAIAKAYAENCTEKAKIAFDLFNIFPEEDQTTVLANGNLSSMWHHITAILLGGWNKCFEILCTASENESTRLLLDAVNQWPSEGQLSGTKNATDFLERLKLVEKSEDGIRRLADNLQSMVTWVKEDPEFPREEAIPVYLFFLELYALSERITTERLDSYSELAGCVLTCAINPDQYKQLLDSAMILVSSVEARKSVGWMIDLVEVVLDNHSPDPRCREQFLWNVLKKIKILGVELEKWQCEALRIILGSLHQGGDEFLQEMPVTEKDSVLTLCAHKSLAIYTLDKNSGKRAKEIISGICPTARVSVNSDENASVHLKHLARNADIFIVVWRSAKHSATLDIKQNRPSDKPLLHSAGKGTSSILRELENHLRDQRRITVY